MDNRSMPPTTCSAYGGAAMGYDRGVVYVDDGVPTWSAFWALGDMVRELTKRIADLEDKILGGGK